jgi:hypothetical protein
MTLRLALLFFTPCPSAILSKISLKETLMGGMIFFGLLIIGFGQVVLLAKADWQAFRQQRPERLRAFAGNDG